MNYKFKNILIIALLLCSILPIKSQTNSKKVPVSSEALVKQFLHKVGNKYYLKLVHTGPNDNYSSYKCPTRKPWGKGDSTLKTVWKELRVDPKTLMVNNGDYTFSKSTGKISHHKNHSTHVPFGTAFGCQSPNNADGSAHIDLRGTPFVVDSLFAHKGHKSAGSIKLSHNKQVAVITGGGYCGWNAPVLANSESKAYTGGWYLKLKFEASLVPVKCNKVKRYLKKYRGKYYINLTKLNYSSYKCPTRKPWGKGDSDLRTQFLKVEIDPKTMLINTKNYTYAKSKGQISHHKNHSKQVPYGTAFGCQSKYNADGKGVIDLRGTPFVIDSDWTHKGHQSAGKVTRSSNNQLLHLKGGGYCGWIAPNLANSEYKAYNGGWYIKVKFNESLAKKKNPCPKPTVVVKTTLECGLKGSKKKVITI